MSEKHDNVSEDNSVLSQQVNWENLYFYQKSDIIYQLSFAFCNRFIHLYKDRTRDQIIQAARSCKQNIVEGLADGITSSEMQMKLLNVARASLKELKEDFEDYVKSRHLQFYSKGEERYNVMVEYCRHHNKLPDYEPFFMKWSDEQMCNFAITLCHMIDKMMMSFLKVLEQKFIKEGGIKERMYRARTGYRNEQDSRLKQLESLVPELQSSLERSKAEVEHWRAEATRLKVEAERRKVEAERLKVESERLKVEAECLKVEAERRKAAYDDLRQRALTAYYSQQKEIERLNKLIGKE